ncbi:MAG: hypothetical protein WCI04_05280 [archaeon]
MMKFGSNFLKKWHIVVQILPILILIIIAKFVTHYLGFEWISLNALFTSIVAATTFLIGFLITGVISDYKESEKIPGDMAASLEVLYDEAYILGLNKKQIVSKEFLNYHKEFIDSLIKWFWKEERTKTILAKLSDFNEYFAKFEKYTQVNFITRIKQEQSNLRKAINRVHNIRETSFVSSAYTIVEVLAVILVGGLLILKIEPFYEAIFFVTVVSFIVIYMIYLIRDLDNPFDYNKNGENGTEISLKPIHDLKERLYENN